MKQNRKEDGARILKWRRIFSHILQILSICFLSLGIVYLPFILVSGAPKNSSVAFATEVAIFIGAILAIFGLITVGLARWIAKEVMWVRPYLITLIAVLVLQDAVTALGAFVLFR